MQLFIDWVITVLYVLGYGELVSCGLRYVKCTHSSLNTAVVGSQFDVVEFLYA